MPNQSNQHKIELIDLAAQQDQIRDSIQQRINAVLKHGRYIMGPEVGELETELARRVGVPHCISTANGTDALQIAMMALGIGAGDEVIVPSYTWIASADTVAILGATPVFVDIDPQTLNIDAAKVAASITERTRAIMAVNLFGQCAQLNTINEIAAEHGLAVIEDAAQSFGATHHGRPSCSQTTIATTSFFPTKTLGCYGDGGAIFTCDDSLANACRSIRQHGAAKKHSHECLGMNGRLDTIQAAVLLAKLDIFDRERELRQSVAGQYDRLLQPMAEAGQLTLPFVSDHNESMYSQYTILTDRRDALQQHLAEQQIASVAYYRVPMHLQPVFKSLGYQPGSLPITESVADRGLSLPMSPWLNAADQQRVIDSIQQFMNT